MKTSGITLFGSATMGAAKKPAETTGAIASAPVSLFPPTHNTETSGSVASAGAGGGSCGGSFSVAA